MGYTLEVSLEKKAVRGYKEYYIVYIREHFGGDYVTSHRAGKLYIKEDKNGKPYFSIFLNRVWQGKHIGSSAVKLFLYLTHEKKFYAVTRVSNLAMNRILRQTGWKKIPGGRQAEYMFEKK